MAAGNNPTIMDPKVLFQGALTTTLTTTLVTAPAEAGVRVTTFIATHAGTFGSGTMRSLTFDYFKATTGRKITNAMPILADGVPRDILALCGGSLILDASDLIRGGQDVGTDIDCLIMGFELKE